MTKKRGIELDPLKEVLKETGREILKKQGEKFLEERKGITLETVLEKMESAKKEMKRNAFIYGLFGLGGFFIFLGLAKYIPIIMGVSEAKGFLIIGIVLILISLAYEAGAKG